MVLEKQYAINLLRNINWEDIFKVIHRTRHMTRNQTRPLRTEFIERAIEKRSNGTLNYTGDKTNGIDYLGVPDNTRYECKLQNGIWRKCGYTSKIILKNFRKKSNPEIKKTFDYMILIDSKNKKVGLCTFEDLDIKVSDAIADFSIKQEKIDIIKENISVDTTDIVDFNSLITELIYPYL